MSTLRPGAADVELVGLDETAAASVSFTDLGSGYYSGTTVADGEAGGCFALRLLSSPIAASARLDSINIVYESPNVLLPAVEDPVYEYKLVPGSIAYVSFATQDGSAVSKDAIFIIKDLDPPVWSGCSSEPIIRLAPLNASGLVVSWPPPVAVDNAGVASTKSTHHPGDWFSIADSPYHIM